MVRYVAPASWILTAGLLAITVGQHGAWATSTPDPVAEIVDNNKVDSSIWSLPEAIAKATGHEPITEWKEYLFKDPFGEEDDVGSTAAIFPLREPKKNGGYQVNWKGGNTGSGSVRGSKVWWPSITCPYGGSMDVDNFGKEKCIGVGQGICKDGWRFGIRHHVDNSYLMLWREDDPMNPVYKWFPGATSLCIGERYPNVAYLRVVYEDCLYYLIGPGAGSADDLSRLKIVADNQRYKPDDVIVKFRDGPGDQNALWQIFANGFSQTSPDALWYPIPCDTESPSSSPSDTPTISMEPSSSPSALPSSSPSASPSSTPSSSPTELPSASPTSTPSASPSGSPTSLPSSSPSSFPTSTPSSEPSISFQPTAASCLPSPTMDIGTNAGGSLTFTLSSMPLASFYVELRTFIRGDFDDANEYADFFWLDSVSGQRSFIGRNGGGEQCGTSFLEETFMIPIDTYNTWVQEGNSTIPIIFDASSEVNVCTPHAEAYIQFQVDEACGTLSLAPSTSPAPSSSPVPSSSPSISHAPSQSPSLRPSSKPSLSAKPSNEPSQSFVPSSSPSNAPSSKPSISSQPTAASCLPSPEMELQEAGGEIVFTLTSMPTATFYVELRTFIRGDYNGGFEYADFFWVNSTSGQVSLPRIGRNNGGSPQCSAFFLEETFVIPVETYNSWLEEGNGTVSILMDASDNVGIFCNDNDAYIQLQVDEDCGTFSNSPSSSPSVAPSTLPTISQSPTLSPAPSSSPSISLAPSSSPSDIPSATPSISLEPSSSPSDSPSEIPTISLRPSQSPSSTPSISPSISLRPSGEPSQSFAPSSSPSSAPSSEPSISSQPTAASCLPSPTMDIGTTPGGSLTFILTSMPLASFYVELRTFVRGDFAASSEYADFFWVNGTEPLPPPANPDNFIGRNGGGGDCEPNYFQQTFVVSVDTYNSWVQEGNGTIPIFMDTSSEVDICGPTYAEAYIQFQVDGGCGTFSLAPSSQPTRSPQPSASFAPSHSPSDIPSSSPSISLAPSVSPRPSSSPSMSSAPSIDYDFAYMRSQSREPWNSQTNAGHMNAVFGVESWKLLFFETFDASNIGNYNFIFMDGSDRGAEELDAFLNSSLPLIEAWVANGGRLFLNAAPNEGGDINFGFGGVTNSRNNFVRRSYSPDSSHPVFTGFFQPIGAEWTGNSFAHSILTGGGISPILVEGSDQSRVVLADLVYQNGYVMFGGLTTTNFHRPQPEASNLRRNILEHTAGVNATGVVSRAEATAAQSKVHCWVNSTHYDWTCENGTKNAEGLQIIASEDEDGNGDDRDDVGGE